MSFGWLKHRLALVVRARENQRQIHHAGHTDRSHTAMPDCVSPASAPVLIIMAFDRSMLVDEDGMVAHEFYEERADGRFYPVATGLRPQVPREEHRGMLAITDV